MDAMIVMSQALRGVIQQYAPTLRELPDDVLIKMRDIVGAFALDLEGEARRRTATRHSAVEHDLRL